MNWDELPEDQKSIVLEVLEREAERIERDAANLIQVAQRLGRPSLVERQELRADAFRAAIEYLSRGRAVH